MLIKDTFIKKYEHNIENNRPSTRQELKIRYKAVGATLLDIVIIQMCSNLQLIK